MFREYISQEVLITIEVVVFFRSVWGHWISSANRVCRIWTHKRHDGGQKKMEDEETGKHSSCLI
jgi:hypothetical protein